MDSSDKELQLESRFFSLKLTSGANQKKKENHVGVGNDKKEQNKGFTIIYCRRLFQ